MNAVTSTWRQLVRRRLWPVAVLLVAALAAVPAFLARDPKTPAAPAAPAESVTTKADAVIAEPVVAEVTPEERSRRRRVLGVRKDPFRPAPVKKAKVDEPSSEPEAKPAGDSSLKPAAGPVDTGGALVVPTPSAPVTPAEPKRYYSPGTIIVRLGDPEGGDSTRFAVRKREPVPSAEEPLLIYMGLTKDGKRAKFLVDASVEVDGDGVCKPHPSNCERVELSVGDIEFLDVIDLEADADDENRVTAQFQLDLVDIKRRGDSDVK